MIENDTWAVAVTFEEVLKEITKITGEKLDVNLQFVKIYQDLKLNNMSLSDCMCKWAFILENDYTFKNNLCKQLKKEYKFLGLPKIHLFLRQGLIKTFYMKK